MIDVWSNRYAITLSLSLGTAFIYLPYKYAQVLVLSQNNSSNVNI